MITILTYIALIAGGILIVLLLLSLIGGFDFDLDVDVDTDMDAGDSDVDSGGIGYIKGGLAFIAVTAWVIRIALMSEQHPVLASVIGLVAGAIAVFLLGGLMRLLLSAQSNVNWKPQDSLFKEAKVYLRIPPDEGTGLIHIKINGALRELKAKTRRAKEIPTGSNVLIEDFDYEKGIAIVELYENEVEGENENFN